MRFFLFIIGVSFLLSCSGFERLQFLDLNPDLNSEITPTLSFESISLEGADPLVIYSGDQVNLALSVSLSDGSLYETITSRFISQQGELRGYVFWYSNNVDIATVSSNGLVTAKEPGSTTIKASLFNQSAMVELIVIEKEVTLSDLSFHQEALEVNGEEILQLTLDVLYSDGIEDQEVLPNTLRDSLPCDLQLSSSNEAVAHLLPSGLLTPTGNGEATLLVECGEFSDTLQTVVTGLDDDVEEEATEEVLESMTLSFDASHWQVGETKTLLCDLNFNTGLVASVSNSFVSPAGNLGNVTWLSDESLLQIDAGVAQLIAYGEAVVTVSYSGISVSQNISIKMAPEDPDDYLQHFLGSDDEYEMEYGTNAGYGESYFPSIVYGYPYDGGLDVVSFGFGGSLLIQFHGYYPVDGPGLDFTLFENPFLMDADGASFAERGRVSVSEDGTHFESFSCNVWDSENIFEGCAGVSLVNALADPLDPLVSGGDSFDLNELGMAEARYLLIEDLMTCVEGDSTYPLCAESYKQGFDLDALAIVNGKNE